MCFEGFFLGGGVGAYIYIYRFFNYGIPDNPFGFAGWSSHRWGVCSGYFDSRGKGLLISAEIFYLSDTSFVNKWMVSYLILLEEHLKSLEPEINRCLKPFKLRTQGLGKKKRLGIKKKLWTQEFRYLCRLCSEFSVCVLMCMQGVFGFHLSVW